MVCICPVDAHAWTRPICARPIIIYLLSMQNLENSWKLGVMIMTNQFTNNNCHSIIRVTLNAITSIAIAIESIWLS